MWNIYDTLTNLTQSTGNQLMHEWVGEQSYVSLNT